MQYEFRRTQGTYQLCSALWAGLGLRLRVFTASFFLRGECASGVLLSYFGTQVRLILLGVNNLFYIVYEG